MTNDEIVLEAEKLKKLVVKLGQRKVQSLLDEIIQERSAQRAYLMDKGGWS